MIVQDYLRLNGINSLLDEYGIGAVRHKKYKNLILFKYNQIDSPHSAPIVVECRGLILDESNDWKVVCRPYDRFFNYEEQCAGKIDWTTARVFEKLDGSLMKMYWYDGAWQVSSSGLPDASGDLNQDTSKCFADLFWETFSKLGYKVPGECLSDFTFMFELMTPENRVLVPHDSYKLVLHGIRSNCFPYLEKNASEINEIFDDSVWKVVESYSLSKIEDVVASSKLLNPMQGEGFVVVDKDFNRVKVKSPQYVALSHMKDSFSERRMIELVRTNEGSEFLSYFPEYAALYVSVKSAYGKLVADLVCDYDRLKSIEPQKEFAIEAVKTRCSGAMFSVRSKKVESIEEYLKNLSIVALEKLLNIRM